MRRLDIDETGDFFECAKDFQTVRMHRAELRAKVEVAVITERLESLERLLEDRKRPVDYGAVLEVIDVPRMYGVDTHTGFRARTVTRNTLAIDILFLWWAASDTCAIIFK